MGLWKDFAIVWNPKKEAGSFPKLPFFRGKLAASFRDSNYLRKDWKFGHIDLYIISTKKGTLGYFPLNTGCLMTGSLPKHSMHVWYIYLQEWLICMVNVSKHTIHGPYGCDIGWFNRDPYIIVYEIPTYTWVGTVIPKLNPKQPGALLFLAQMISLGGTFKPKNSLHQTLRLQNSWYVILGRSVQ